MRESWNLFILKPSKGTSSFSCTKNVSFKFKEQKTYDAESPLNGVGYIQPVGNHGFVVTIADKIVDSIHHLIPNRSVTQPKEKGK